jgi:predicted HD superfamily hydrolase involved in NAD metabolism
MGMWSEDKIIDYLKANLKRDRYDHSISVRDTAVKLASIYKSDINKARIAGLIHDAAKNLKDKEIIDLVSNRGFEIDYVCRRSPQLLHGLAASIIAQDVMEIDDEEILNAVIYHTTGKKNMSMLEKIIYISDYVEPLRKFPGVEELRRAVEIDLDDALLKSFDLTIKYVIDRKQLLHLDTIEGRNYLLCNSSR